jgi:inosine/xanthosine triphosphatase
MKLVVASTNPTKVTAVTDAFRTLFPNTDATVEGCNPGFDLPAQPMTDGETKDCAIARNKAVRQAAPDADYWIAIEGGLETVTHGVCHTEQFNCLAWIIVQNKDGYWSEARTASFPIPQEVGRLIRSGIEMGHANDQIFGHENSKHGSGMTGIVTNNAIDRTDYYTHAMTLAFAPYKNADIYFQAAE